MVLAHVTTDGCPSDQNAPDLLVGPGALMTDGTADWCVHDDPRLSLPEGTTTDEDGTLVPPAGWQFTTDGLTPKDES